MMLPPFRIRNLYGQARHGVVQITAPQYDSTLKSHPDAALRYLDEDDGETITVGSGFELSQRLDEPVPLLQAAIVGENQDDENSVLHDIHTFDIERKSQTVATWMDHEAYSSKALRKATSDLNSPSKITDALPDILTSNITDSLEEGSDSAESDQSRHARLDYQTELEMYEEMQDKEVDASVPISIQTTSDAQTSATSLTIKDRKTSDEVEKIVSNAVENIASNLDAHIETLADFLQNTAKVLRFVAEKTRESDTSAVENILSGFNTIFGEVGKLAKDVLAPINPSELAPNTSPAELDLQSPSPTISHTEVPKADMNTENKESELSASVEVVSECADLPSPVVGSSPAPTSRTLPTYTPEPFSEFGRGTELTARIASSKLDELYHIPSKAFIANQPLNVSTDKDQVWASLQRGGFNPDTQRKWKCTPLPDTEQAEKMKKRVDFALPKANNTIRPRETTKSSSETFARSILDIEAQDPDFSARFPPLLSARRVRLMKPATQRSRSPECRMSSRQDALTRYPSVQQLESSAKGLERRSFDSSMQTAGGRANPTTQMHRTWFEDVEAKQTSSPKNVFMKQSEEVEEVIAAVGRDITEASNEVRRLPGAWPDAQQESKKHALPPSGESSGAFFNRMMWQGPRSDENDLSGPGLVQGKSFSANTHQLGRAKSMVALRPSATLTKPFDPLVPAFIGPAPADIGDKSPVPRGTSRGPEAAGAPESAATHNIYSPDPSPSRVASTNITSSNPQSREGIRRSLTEKMPHRRPYSHRYSGAGRLPWENFEDRSFDLRSGSFVQRHERVRRTTEKPVLPLAPPPPPPPPGPAVIRQNPAHPIILPNDLHKRVYDYRTGLRHRASAPSVGIAKQSKINNCIRQLKDMGFGSDDNNEESRLAVYAAATSGNIVEAVEMIEEDRKAADTFRGGKKLSGPENGPGGWL